MGEESVATTMSLPSICNAQVNPTGLVLGHNFAQTLERSTHTNITAQGCEKIIPSFCHFFLQGRLNSKGQPGNLRPTSVLPFRISLHFAYMTGAPPYTPVFPETPRYVNSTVPLSLGQCNCKYPTKSWDFLRYCAQLVQHSPCTKHHTPKPGSKTQTALWELSIPYQASVPSQEWY